MDPKDLDNLYRLLAGYWYDRNDEDEFIVKEFIGDMTRQQITEYIDLIRRFIDSDISKKDKEKLIRKAVWLYLPEDEEDAPIIWLKKVLVLIEKHFKTK